MIDPAWCNKFQSSQFHLHFPVNIEYLFSEFVWIQLSHVVRLYGPVKSSILSQLSKLQ